LEQDFDKKLWHLHNTQIKDAVRVGMIFEGSGELLAEAEANGLI
jgi:hypothetical protein